MKTLRPPSFIAPLRRSRVLRVTLPIAVAIWAFAALVLLPPSGG